MPVCPKLPDIILLDDFNGAWNEYVEALYNRFKQDFVIKKPTFLGKNVDIIHEKFYQNKERSFWHIISTGGTDDDRLPDMERCEKIGWAKALILDDGNCSDYKLWIRYCDKSKRDRYYIMCAENNYLVILEDRNSHFKIITAYCVEEYMVKKYLADYARYQQTKTPT